MKEYAKNSREQENAQQMAEIPEVLNAPTPSAEELLCKQIKQSSTYLFIAKISKLMDNSFKIFGIPIGLDPLIGFLPIAGDMIAPAMGLPMIYLSLLKIKSLPLTLAIVLNLLIDVAIGIIPFHIGNIADFFNKAHIRNMNLITGYLDGDKKTIDNIHRQATIAALLILLLIFIIYLLIALATKIATTIGGIFA